MSYIEYALIYCPECEEEYQLPECEKCVFCGSEVYEIE